MKETVVDLLTPEQVVQHRLRTIANRIGNIANMCGFSSGADRLVEIALELRRYEGELREERNTIKQLIFEAEEADQAKAEQEGRPGLQRAMRLERARRLRSRKVN